MATPIDIKSVDVTFTFDMEQSEATADARVEFEMGETAGRPILDLRQQVYGIQLDGEVLDPELLPFQDFGGGEDAEMRLLDRVLEPCADHVLRLAYYIGPPTGTPVTIEWSADTVWFRSATSDLRPAGLAEQWMPANLSYDVVALTMELELSGDAAPHVVFANGEVEQLDTQRWRIVFPDHFTAFSPFFALMPADRVEEHTRVVALPGGDVTVEGYFEAGLDVNGTLNALEAGLLDFEDMYGPYAHGDRFVAYVRQDPPDIHAMEYEGATHTHDDPDTVRHELFHSWFARGVRPITATDGWWDEAWTVYNTPPDTFLDYEALPGDYPATPLYDPNPWVRQTNLEAYDYGTRVFATIREAITQDVLIELMRQFYLDNQLALVSTDELEQLLYCQGGEEPEVRQIFHHFVHGNEGDAPPPPGDYCN
jgi:hypothetical protein